MSELERNKFQVVESQSFNDELTTELNTLKQKDIRIILGNFDEAWARQVLIHSHKKNDFTIIVFQTSLLPSLSNWTVWTKISVDDSGDVLQEVVGKGGRRSQLHGGRGQRGSPRHSHYGNDHPGLV